VACKKGETYLRRHVIRYMVPMFRVKFLVPSSGYEQETKGLSVRFCPFTITHDAICDNIILKDASMYFS
jgi:hypothetical protein